MKSFLYHLQINISFKNLSFYEDLMTFLGWSVIFETDNTIGFKSEENGNLWFVDVKKKAQSDFDNKGVNLISIRVEKSSDVDEVVEFLKKKNVESLFGTPKHRPEFISEESQTYYQVMFKSKDNILFEVVYVGAKK